MKKESLDGTNIEYEETEPTPHSERQNKGGHIKYPFANRPASIPRPDFQQWKNYLNNLYSNFVKFTFFQKSIDFLGIIIYNVYCRLNNVYGRKKIMVNEQEKNIKSKKFSFPEIDWKNIGYGIIGIGRLLAVISMFYSAIVIYVGADDLTSKALIAPMVVFATIITVKVFFKQGDK